MANGRAIPCPCCRAANDAGPACRRCKADLSLLFAVEEQRDRHLAEAKQLAAEGRVADALSAVDDAESLRRGDDVLRLRAALHLLNRDFNSALAYYSAAGKSADRRGGP
jgi:hypothetical protein